MSYFKYNNRKVFYEEYGNNEKVLLLLHGNTASSNMFNDIKTLYANKYKILLIDFLGCGRSDRVKELDNDLWFDEANQVIKLLDILKYKNVDIIGTSGGAIVGINVGLERPDLVHKIVADSFEGEHSIDAITNNIVIDRNNSKLDENAKTFYYLMNGNDWESVVDADTKAIYNHSKTIKNFYHKELNELSVPILFTGSEEDEFMNIVGKNYYNELFNNLIKKVKNGNMYIFKHGFHPAMMSSMEEFLKISIDFLER